MHVARVVCDYDGAIGFYTRKLRFWLLEGAGHVPALTRPARIPPSRQPVAEAWPARSSSPPFKGLSRECYI